MHHDITLPRLGEAVPEASVAGILVNEGDVLKEGQVYAHVQTDKADIELPSPLSGIVRKICAEVGQVVKMGEAILVLDSDLDLAQARSHLERANVQAGLLYLSTKDANDLCSRKELGDRLRFDDHKSFVEEVISIARVLRPLSLDKLEPELLEDLKDCLFFVSSLIKELVGFNPARLGSAKLAKHQRISQFLSNNQDRALRDFSGILARAREQVGPPSRKGWVRVGHEDKAYVFISYSHTDKKFASNLAAELDAARIQYFLDTRSIAPGDPIDDRVHDALNHASHMVVLISPGSEDSAWVPYEMGYAKAKEIIVVPYLLHERMKIPGFISKYMYLQGAEGISSWIRTLREYQRSPNPVGQPWEFFSEWSSPAAQEALRTAHEICHQAVASYTFLNEASELLAQLVQRGGRIRCVLIDPYGEAIAMATHRVAGYEGRLEHMVNQLERARETLHELAKAAGDPTRVQLRIIDHVPEPVMTIIDPHLRDGTMFVTLNGFEQRLPSRPSFVLRRGSDDKWFQFYYESFENLWTHPRCEKVDLDRGFVKHEK